MAINILSSRVNNVLIQSGNGIPSHISKIGSIFIDLNTGDEYHNKNGISNWEIENQNSGGSDIYITGFTYNSNIFTIFDNTGNTYSVNFQVVTGLTVNGIISATTYSNLPLDITVTGGTYSNGTAIFINNTGGTFNVTGFNTETNYLPLSGGSVSGLTYFNSGLTATSITATTYYGNGSNLTGINASFTGGTVTGSTTFTNTLTGSASGLTEVQPTVKFIQNFLTTGSTWSPISDSTALATQTAVANRLYISPFILTDTTLVTKLNTEVISSGSGVFYTGVYELDSNYLPTGSALISTTGMSATTNGLKVYTLTAATTLQSNKWYGLAIISTVNLAHRTAPAYPYFGSMITSAVHLTSMYRDVTPSSYSSLPTAGTMLNVSNVTPGVFFTR